MKHLHTIMIVAVLHMSTMCSTKSVVLGVTSDGEDDVSTSHMEYSDADSMLFSDSDSSVITAPNETPSERHASVSRHTRRARGYPVDSEPESIYDSPHTTSYGRTPSHDKRGCFPYNHKNYDGDWEQDWHSDAEEDPRAPRPRRNEEYRGTRYSYNDRRPSPTPRERKDLREEKIPTCSDNEASASERRTRRERSYPSTRRPRCNENDLLSFRKLTFGVRKDLYAMIGYPELDSISFLNKNFRRDVGRAEACGDILRTYKHKGRYSKNFFQQPDASAVQWLASYQGANAAALRHDVMSQLYRQPRETIRAWLKKAPLNLVLYGHRDNDGYKIYPSHLATVEDRAVRAVRDSTPHITLPTWFNDAYLWSDPVFALEAVSVNPEALCFVKRQPTKADYYEIARKALRRIPWLFSEVKAEWLTEEQYCNIVSEAVGHTPSLLENVNIKKLSRSRQELLAITRKAIREDPFLLFHAQDVLTALGCYYDMALDAVRHRARASDHQEIFTLECVASRGLLTRDQYYKIAYEAVRREPLALRGVDREGLYEEQYFEIACKAVKRNFRALQYVTYARDFEDLYLDVVRVAVTQDPKALKYIFSKINTRALYNREGISDPLLNIIKGAINEDYRALQYVDPIICAQDYPHIMRTAERISLRAPQYVHPSSSTEAYSERMATFLCYWGSKDRCEDWEAYYETAMRAVQHDPSLIYYVSTKNWHRYYSVARVAVRQDGEALRYVKLLAADPDACEAYYNLANEMVQSRPIAFQYVKLSYGSRGACKAYYDLASKMVQLFPWTIKYIKTRNWETYYELAIEAVRQDPRAIKYVSTSNQNDYFDAACMALEKNHRVFNDINKNVLTNRQYRYICKAYDEACAWENSLRRRRHNYRR